jgi:predicted nucleic acid-binding protein
LRIAFADTSAVLAVVFGEPGGIRLGKVLGSLDRLLASDLLEAEVLCAAAREGVDRKSVGRVLANVSWVHPERRLTREFEEILAAGMVRGADMWHLACALYVAGTPADLPFLTLDRAQARLARDLGFPGLEPE